MLFRSRCSRQPRGCGPGPRHRCAGAMARAAGAVALAAWWRLGWQWQQPPQWRQSQSWWSGSGATVSAQAPSPSASSSSRRGSIAAGCGCGCSIARPSPPPVAGWCCAPRRWGGRGSGKRPQAQGRCGGCERAGKAHQATQVWGRGAVGRGCADRRSWVWGRPYRRLSTITGAGLDPSCTPAGIPSSGSDGEGCWGGEAAGTDANVGVVSVRVVAVPEGGAGVVRIVDPRAAAQQLGDPPSTATYARNRVLTMPQGRR